MTTCRVFQSPTCMALVAFLSFLSVQTASAGWGAIEPDNADRPDLRWLANFATKANIIATGNIGEAIARCDRTVGRNGYCVVELGSATPPSPFTISRSRTKITAQKRAPALIAIAGQATISFASNIEKVVVENLQLKGIQAGSKPVHGIVVYGQNISDIVLRKNQIHQFDSDTSAHGIVVLGTGISHKNSIKRVTIENNHVHDMRTGASESIAINGNVTNWVIRKNTIERVNNIAIDAIGGEGTVPPVKHAGRVVPSPLDVARNGWIEDNTVTSMTTLNNPAYGRQRSWAGAIYVDGGRSINITGNSVSNAPWAFDIGAENCVVTRDITLHHNTAVNSHFGDLRLGGYSATGYLEKNNSVNCDPTTTEDVNEGHGYVRRLTITENRFNSLQTVVENIFIEYRTTESIIAQPGVSAQIGLGDGTAVGDGNAFRVVR